MVAERLQGAHGEESPAHAIIINHHIIIINQHIINHEINHHTIVPTLPIPQTHSLSQSLSPMPLLFSPPPTPFSSPVPTTCLVSGTTDREDLVGLQSLQGALYQPCTVTAGRGDDPRAGRRRARLEPCHTAAREAEDGAALGLGGVLIVEVRLVDDTRRRLSASRDPD